MWTSTAVLDRVGGAFGCAVALATIAAPSFGAPLLLPVATALIVAWIVWRDGASFTIPNAAVAALALVGVAARVASDGASMEVWLGLGADIALTGGLLWLLREGFFRLRGHDGLGFGDVKLAAAAGCLVGAAGFAVALLAASLAGLAFALLRRTDRNERIAFGVLLAPAIWMVWASEAVAPHLVFTQALAG